MCNQSDGCSWLCHAECACQAPGWMPPAWDADARSGNLLPAAPDNPGGAISNGYVGAWVPRSLPGSAGSPVCGVEHVKGVFSPASGSLFGYDNTSKKVQLANLASWTATSYLASIGSAKLPATASAMDFRRGAYRVAAKAADVECVQNLFAHRSQPHLLVSEFVCENKGSVAETVTIEQGRCNPLSLVPNPVNAYVAPRSMLLCLPFSLSASLSVSLWCIFILHSLSGGADRRLHLRDALPADECDPTRLHS